MPVEYGQAIVRWGAWFEDRDLALDVPKDWMAKTCKPRGAGRLARVQLEASLDRPIGSPPLEVIARGKQAAIIVVDDLTRPTPVDQVLPMLLSRLARGGMADTKIRILIALGAHPRLTPELIKKKIGRKVAERFPILLHDSHRECDYLGESSGGVPIYLNREYLQADLRICVGSILPHGLAGFGGGAKLIVPGVAGIDTIEALHRLGTVTASGPGEPPRQTVRSFIEEATGKAPPSFAVNAILGQQREFVGLFCGDFIDSYREGLPAARSSYSTEVPAGWDIAILSAYPKDTEFYQCSGSFAVIDRAPQPVIDSQGTVVVCSAASLGMGKHLLMGPGGRLGHQTQLACRIRALRRNAIYYSKTIAGSALEPWGIPAEALCNSWQAVLDRLRQRHGDKPRVAVFPCAAAQVAAGEVSGLRRTRIS